MNEKQQRVRDIRALIESFTPMLGNDRETATYKHWERTIGNLKIEYEQLTGEEYDT